MYLSVIWSNDWFSSGANNPHRLECQLPDPFPQESSLIIISIIEIMKEKRLANKFHKIQSSQIYLPSQIDSNNKDMVEYQPIHIW